MIEVRNILCPVDFTPISHRNVRMAVEMSKRIGSRIVLHHNLDVRPPGFLSVSWMWSEDHEAEEERKAAQVSERMEELIAEIPDSIEYEAKVSRGPLEATLLYLAQELPADLIIMGTHGRSSAEHHSLTERIIIQAPCSVLTIGEGYVPEEVFDSDRKRPPEEMKFLVPVDFSPRSPEVLDFAFTVAEGMPHRVDVFHVVRHGRGAEKSVQSDREVQEVHHRMVEMLPESVADRTSYQVKVGKPVEEILKAANEQDALCIVMGAHGKSPLRRFLFGTTTMSILHGAKCPVWFVPQVARKRFTRNLFEALEGG